MKSWNKAFYLTRFELKHTALSFLGVFVISMFMITIGFTLVYSSINRIVIDWLFLAAFTIGPVLYMPKFLLPKKINLETLASPLVVSYFQLPIPLDIIIKSRIIIFLLFSLPIHTATLFSYYFIINPSLINYLAFTSFFLTLNFLFGMIISSTQIGRYTGFKSSLYDLLIITCIIIAFSFTTFLSDYLYKQTFLEILLKIMSINPLLTLASMIIITFISLKIWIHRMKKNRFNLNYL